MTPLLALLALLGLQLTVPLSRRRRRSWWTVASYNISPEDRPGARRRIERISRIRGLIFIGMQEARWYSRERLPESMRRRGWRRPINGDVDEQVLFRNAQGFVGKGSMVNVLAKGKSHWIEPAAAGPTKADERTISWVWGEVDGELVAMGDLHLVPSVHLPKADKLSEAQVASIAGSVAYWLARGVHVVLVGDFNLLRNHPNLRPLLNGFPLPGRRTQKGRLRIANNEWTHSKGTRGTQRQIDHIMVSDGIEVIATRTIAGHRHNDHRIPLARLALAS